MFITMSIKFQKFQKDSISLKPCMERWTSQATQIFDIAMLTNYHMNIISLSPFMVIWTSEATLTSAMPKFSNMCINCLEDSTIDPDLHLLMAEI